jgi:hypothetical protein
MWAERMVYTHRRRSTLGKPMEPGRSRPEAYLRTLADASSSLFATWKEG